MCRIKDVHSWRFYFACGKRMILVGLGVSAVAEWLVCVNADNEGLSSYYNIKQELKLIFVKTKLCYLFAGRVQLSALCSLYSDRMFLSGYYNHIRVVLFTVPNCSSLTIYSVTMYAPGRLTVHYHSVPTTLADYSCRVEL